MGFDINNFLNAESKKEVKSDWKPVKLSVHKLLSLIHISEPTRP